MTVNSPGTMEENKKKRKLSASQALKKRRKLRQPDNKPKRPVRVDELKWRTVEVPEMFDDAEGFYGLEEIDGVDVVRQGDTVQFMAAVSSDESDEFEGFDDPVLPVPEETAPCQTKLKDHSTKDHLKPTKDTSKEKQIRKPNSKDLSATKSVDGELEPDLFSKLADVEDTAEDLDLSAWVPLDLSPRIMSSIARLKFSKPTAIQSEAIPQILRGSDVIGKASTGSGKTLAFSIPIVESWLVQYDQRGPQTSHSHPTALILSPTRELAHQITNHIKDLCAGLPASPYVCSVTGGLSVQKQQRQLEKADIVIATPGRLWEVMNSSNSLLSAFREVQFLVIDEADRLLTEGHFKELEEILNALDRTEVDEDDEQDSDEAESSGAKRQTLVFSATFNKSLQQRLSGKGRYNLMNESQSMEYLLKKLNFRDRPKFIDVNPVSQMAEGLKEGLLECGAMEKDLYLYAILLLQSTRRALVFTNSIGSVRRLTPLLQNLGLPAVALHSEMAQKARLRAIERFTTTKSGNTSSSILVATDVAARGLDIPGIELVVHYHVPRTADAYVHRSGRTARAEQSGLSILMCAPEEVTPTRRLVAKVHAAAAGAGKKENGEKDSTKNKQPQSGFFIRTVDIDRKLVSRLRERVVLAKKIADAQLAKERGSKEESWIKAAAEELGVDYDSDELEEASKWGGRGSGKKKKEKEAREMTKAEIGALRAELKALLSKRVNQGVSEKYIANGTVDIDELLRGARGTFLGKVDGLGLED
ncbi:hypothetical protein VTK73DRAFT_3032 [Phialemonium thermophilum]|uniref:ATP-dependent RNA helicase n=1 Tax=Phialemonium thermophilum TaxID=223376 RepID=A0ABR3X1D0_9PEZI